MSDPFTTLDNVILYALAREDMTVRELAAYTGMAPGDVGLRLPGLAQAGEVAEATRHSSDNGKETVWQRVRQ